MHAYIYIYIYIHIHIYIYIYTHFLERERERERERESTHTPRHPTTCPASTHLAARVRFGPAQTRSTRSARARPPTWSPPSTPVVPLKVFSGRSTRATQPTHQGTAGARAPAPQGARASGSPYAPHLVAHADLAVPYGEVFNVQPLPRTSTKAKEQVLPKGTGFSDVPLLPRTSDGALVLPDGRRVQAGEEGDDCDDVDELEHARLAVHAMLGATSEIEACEKLQKMGIAGAPVAMPPKLQRLVRGREHEQAARRAQVA